MNQVKFYIFEALFGQNSVKKKKLYINGKKRQKKVVFLGNDVPAPM